MGNGFYGTVTVNYTTGGPPTVTSYSPTSGCIGNQITITGTNFTGASAVTFFNNVNAITWSVVNSTTITATIPAGAATGVIMVTNGQGTGTGPSFTVNGTAPTITCASNQSVGANGNCQALVNYTVTTSSGTLAYVFSGATSGSGSGTGTGSTFNKVITTVTET